MPCHVLVQNFIKWGCNYSSASLPSKKLSAAQTQLAQSLFCFSFVFVNVFILSVPKSSLVQNAKAWNLELSSCLPFSFIKQLNPNFKDFSILFLDLEVKKNKKILRKELNKDWILKKQTTVAFGQCTTISDRLFADYIDIFHKI